MGLLTKDAMNSGPGDFPRTIESSHDCRTLTGDRLFCAVSSCFALPGTTLRIHSQSAIAAAPFITLHLNGVDISSDKIQATIETTADFGINEVCGFESFSARTTTLANNIHDWAIGASNDSAPQNAFIRILNGDIDELRFRDQPFDRSDAERIRDFIQAQN